MYTPEETLNEIKNLDKWGSFITEWRVENRYAIVWRELVENKDGPSAWKDCYIVRYWEDGVWVDTRYFKDDIRAEQFARDFVNQWFRYPQPTD